MNGAENAAKGLVFVSYCHDDREWLRRFRVMLAPVARNGQLEVWADDQILAGDRWRPELEDAIRRARIALLLVSPEFLASRFIVYRELPALREQGARLVPVLVRQCLWRYEPLLAEVQWAHDPDRDGALAAPHPREWDGRIVRVCNRVLELLPAGSAGAPAQAATAATERLPAAARFAPVEAAGHAEMVGLLDGAPPLPAEYVARAELAGLTRALLEPGSGALGLTGNVRALGLHGQGGIGKTVLAAALAHDERVRAHFPDGAFWVTMGERANLVATQLDLLARLGLPDAAVRSAHHGRRLLKETLAGRWVLLVVDDVWSVAAATAFRATGPGGRVLYTTRYPNVLAKVGARVELVEVLSVPVARQLLARITGDLATALPAEADRVLAATGRVALAVALVGAAVRGGVSWAQAAAELDRGGETFLDHPYANTFKALQLATGALAQQLGEAYLSLAVYPRDTRIPVAAVARYWRQLRDAPPEQTRAELQMLAGRELLTLDADEIAFHDLQHDYLLLRVDDLSLRHADLLAIYRALLPPDGSGEWWQLPRDEPYIWDHLIHHLSGAGNGAEIVATVTDLAYLTMRIALGGQPAAEDDLALALTRCSYQLPGDDRLLRPLLSRIRQSIDLLERCDSRESFCPTLAGRLQDAPELADFAVGLSRCVKDSVIHVEGPPHDTDDRRLVGRLPKRGAGIKALSWLAEPDRVGVAFRDGAVRLWEPSTHKLHQSTQQPLSSWEPFLRSSVLDLGVPA